MGMGKLTQANEELSHRYRDKGQRRELVGKKEGFMESEAHRSAYAVSRMPATYSVVRRALKELYKRIPSLAINSLLDLGCGPGTAVWAVADVFPELGKATLIERDAQLIAMGKRFAAKSEHPAVSKAEWLQGNLQSEQPFPAHDLVILSYVIGEFTETVAEELVRRAWQATKQALVVIEPGTPAGFERIRAARAALIASGAHLAAPCPHAEACPMSGGDWCHFAERVERTSRHRQVKGGSLNYEDEKFSYVVGVRQPCALPEARILRHPLKRTGHVCLTLCTKKGLKQRTVSRKEGDLYKEARKLEWGDEINQKSLEENGEIS